jgi:uncharacterized protein
VWQIPLIIAGSLIVSAIVLGVLLQQQPAPAGAIDGIVASATWPVLLEVLLVVAVVTPVWEEVLFRGLLFSSLTRHLPAVVAALVPQRVRRGSRRAVDGRSPVRRSDRARAVGRIGWMRC